MPINLDYEEVILQINRLVKSGQEEVAKNAMEKIDDTGHIDERAVAIIKAEKDLHNAVNKT